MNSDLIDYCPWLQTGDAMPGTSACHYIEGSGFVEATSSFTGGTITIAATGGHTICTLKYASNPAGPPNFTSLGNFWDVYLNRDNSVNNMEAIFGPIGTGGAAPAPTPTPTPTATASATGPQAQAATAFPATASGTSTDIGIYYWDVDTWKPCSNQEVIDGYVEVTINNSTSPNLSDLTGQIFADGILVPEQYGGGGGPTVGGQVMMINKAQLVTQWIGLPMRLIMGLAF